MDTSFDIVFYKKVYPKLNRFSNPVVMSHWATQGIEKQLLGSEGQFYSKFPDFDLDVYLKYNKGLKMVGLRSKESLLGHFWHHGYYEKRVYKDVRDNCTVSDIVENYSVNHCFISDDLSMFSKKITTDYNLSLRIKGGMPVIMFDINKNHKDMIYNHTSNVYLIFTQSDMDLDSETVTMIKSSNVSMTFCTSGLLAHKLRRLSVPCRLITLPLIDNTMFRPPRKLGDCIYVCNGRVKGHEKTYGHSEYTAALADFPKNKIICSNTLNTKYDNMPDVYAKCFMALRLTGPNDVNTRSIEELKMMNIPIVHNHSDYGLKWKNVNDVKAYVMNKYTAINNSITRLDKKNLELVRTNIKSNLRLFEKYKRVLIICDGDDHMNVLESESLADTLSKKNGSNVDKVYYHNKKTLVENDDNTTVIPMGKLRCTLRAFDKTFDLVIIKNSVPVDLKRLYSCDIFYLPSPYERNVPNGRSVIKTVKIAHRTLCSDSRFVNSHERMSNMISLFYVNLLRRYKTTPIEDKNFNDRPYTYGVFVDTVDNINIFLDKFDKKDKVILLGKTAKSHSKTGFTCTEKVTDNILKKIKYICTDTTDGLNDLNMVDGIFNGCKSVNVNDMAVKNVIKSEEVKHEIEIIKPTDKGTYIETKICNNTKEIYDLVMKCKCVCILDRYRYNSKKLKQMEKIIEHFDKYNIKVIYLLFTDRTLFLHNSISNIKYVDYANKDDLEFMYMKVIHENIDMLLINDEKVESYPFVDKIKMSSKSVMNVKDINTKMDSMCKDNVKVFINFEAKDIAYGGGNVFVQNIVKHINTLPNVHVTFKLEEGIDIYFLVDIRKDGRFKKYTFEEIYDNKVKNGKGKIVYRINDCDVTRQRKTLEPMIMKYFDYIDHFVFNSNFIRSYYFDKYEEFETKRNSIIFNMSDGENFYPNSGVLNRKLKIATHHWSDNMNKGYEFYHKLYKYSQTHDDLELVFIGRKFNDSFEDKPRVIGPLKGLELANALRGCDMYVTGSIFDACPMHVLEGLSCGLPMLYIDHEGGGRDICNFTNEKVGESFSTFEELLDKIKMIRDDYRTYRKNIVNNLKMYNSDDCYARFVKVFVQEKL